MERISKKYKLTTSPSHWSRIRAWVKRMWAAYKPLCLLVIGALLVMAYIPCRISAAQHRMSPGIGGEIFVLLGGLAALVAACREVK